MRARVFVDFDPAKRPLSATLGTAVRHSASQPLVAPPSGLRSCCSASSLPPSMVSLVGPSLFDETSDTRASLRFVLHSCAHEVRKGRGASAVSSHKKRVGASRWEWNACAVRDGGEDARRCVEQARTTERSHGGRERGSRAARSEPGGRSDERLRDIMSRGLSRWRAGGDRLGE